jgi:23S rRNA (cytosine1962-C5)-methyltransferase
MKKHKNNLNKPLTISSNAVDDYELIDSGNSRKLERFGAYVLDRFEPQAVWKPALSSDRWQQAAAAYRLEKGKPSGKWQIFSELPEEWQISIKDLSFSLRLRQSRHIGIFPEQSPSWQWIEDKIKAHGETTRVLNLFGYTGAASLFSARAGAQVIHVDASRSAVKWAQANQELNGLGSLPIRWIVDDALKFVEREARRGSQYDAIMLDPPKFGRGPKGETWKFDRSVIDLLQKCFQILSPDPLFIYLTAYDVRERPEDLSFWLSEMMRPFAGQVEYGWLVQQEKSAGRKINQSMFARWYTIK